MRHCLLIPVSASLCCLASYSAAQTPSDVGAVQQQVRCHCQVSDEPISSIALEHAMLPADNLVDIDVSGGTNDGKVDLALRLTDETLSINRVVGNKGGLYSTNAERITAELAHNSLLRLGDQLDLKLQHGQDSDYLHADWMLPLGGDGWHLSVKEEHTNYRIMTHASISGWGKSTTLGLDTGSAKGPSHQGNLHLSAKLNHKLTYT